MSTNINDKIVFGVAESFDNTGKVIIVGVPKGAWNLMAEGRTHNFDLAKAGLPVKLIMFGAPTHDEAMGLMSQSMSPETIDARKRDWSIRVPEWSRITSEDDYPKDGYFQIWSPDHPDCPVTVKASIFRSGRCTPGMPKHLSFNHFTHWAPCLPPPADVKGGAA